MRRLHLSGVFALVVFFSAVSGSAASDVTDGAQVEPVGQIATAAVQQAADSSKHKEEPKEKIVAADVAAAARSLGKRAAAPQSSQPPAAGATFRVTDADLLPFSEFNVQQPAFSELMRTWPPTTRQQSPAASRRPADGPKRRPRPPHDTDTSSDADDSSQQQPRNYLNEDLDDTVVTADESFQLDQLAEPPTSVNYLGQFGDWIYSQLRQFSEQSPRSPFAASAPQTALAAEQPTPQSPPPPDRATVEAIDNQLDDLYYDEYENSQVLYYGPQLAYAGDILEIGCYLPVGHAAEWTKSGQLVGQSAGAGGNLSAQATQPALPRLIRNDHFLGAKQNFSLKIFEVALSDTGNYRCTRMSRKYHKLVVVPQKSSVSHLYVYQQRLLSLVGRRQPQAPQHALGGRPQPNYTSSSGAARRTSGGALIKATGSSSAARDATPTNAATNAKSAQRQLDSQQLLPGHLIVEGQPMLVACNISDGFVLQRLRDLPQFQLSWFKNGKMLSRRTAPSAERPSAGGVSAAAAGAPGGSVQASRPQQQAAGPATQAAPSPGGQRIQFVGPNGRQLFISAAAYSDAGEYLCSWSRLPRQVSSIAA